MTLERVRDRHADDGRDLVLYVGRNACGLRGEKFSAVAGMGGHKTVSVAILRYEGRLRKRKASQELQ